MFYVRGDVWCKVKMIEFVWNGVRGWEKWKEVVEVERKKWKIEEKNDRKEWMKEGEEEWMMEKGKERSFVVMVNR